MKRVSVILTAIVLAAGTCSGCVPKEDSTNISIDPDFSEPSVIELDFTELNNTAIAAFGNVSETPYTFISSLSIDGDNESKTITADAEAVDGATSDDAQHFAAALLRHIDDAACDQYTTFEMSDSDSFGSLYDSYAVKINITNEKDGSVIYTLDIPAGDEITLDPDIESYEEEWKEYGDLYLKGQADEESQYQAELDAEDAAESEAAEGEAAADAVKEEETAAAGNENTESESDTAAVNK